ncbi:ATP-binding protein [Trichocoleus sp. ST-U2]
MNVLSNAMDALDERDAQRSPQEIKENPSRITICTQLLNPQQVQIRIADNGRGMTETVRQRLFEPFFTTKSIGKGTGLGLSISYQVVVEKHGGQLECISSPGKGAEFLITLPLVTKVTASLESGILSTQVQLND